MRIDGCIKAAVFNDESLNNLNVDVIPCYRLDRVTLLYSPIAIVPHCGFNALPSPSSLCTHFLMPVLPVSAVVLPSRMLALTIMDESVSANNDAVSAEIVLL